MLELTPIGYVRTSLGTKVEAARQPRAGGAAAGRIELLPGRNFEHALADLDAWDYIWVLFWFDRNAGWRPKVLPPRSRTGRKGVFATRSPHRPNPLGLSAVRLVRIEGLTLQVRDLDMLDGTPVLDLKPYVPYTDAIAGVGSGWLERDAGEAPADPIAPYAVEWSAVAAERALWVEQRTGLSLRERATATLTLGPEPHPYRRIRRAPLGFILAVKEWRLHFAVAGRAVSVATVTSGHRAARIAARDGASAELAVHREFRERWPE
ncbi:MAG TPA: tRNA (N6-threonylcarbamoyladenosine(37)-N6)-methyltransferase TrmO [Gammaproteobacteria bacterium]|nr:tRNA (N6-threonylcarbamoyladenosine(37)-N6)-methyltransferase TrmO [Gammaproteobacteria bacterium]